MVGGWPASAGEPVIIRHSWRSPEDAESVARLVSAGRIGLIVARSESVVQGCDAAVLSTVECARRDSFRDAAARLDFVAGRVIARHVLAALLGLSPGEVPLVAPSFGKPHVQHHPPEFSLSHSGGWIACGLVLGRRIGIDIEEPSCDALADTRALAERVCSSRETKALDLFAAGERAPRFFDLWRRKEAVLKAAGLGFSVDPRDFTVLSESGIPCAQVRLGGSIWRIAVSDGIPPVAVAFETWRAADRGVSRPNRAPPTG